MAKSITERVSEWREKKRRQGGRPITIMLEPEVAAAFDDLQEKLDLSQAAVIAKAILALARQTGEEKAQGDLFSPPPSPLEAVKAKLASGANAQACRPDIEALIQGLTAEGLSLRAIASQLNDAGIPTLSGKGGWSKSQIGRMVKK